LQQAVDPWSKTKFDQPPGDLDRTLHITDLLNSFAVTSEEAKRVNGAGVFAGMNMF